MKKVFIVFFAILFSCAAYSQNDKESEKREQNGEFRIEAAGFGISVDRDSVSSFEYEYKFRSARRPKRVTGSFGIASMDIGFNSFQNLKYHGNWAGKGEFLDLNGWKSVRFAWEPVAVRISMDRKGICNFSAGLRLTTDNFTFSEPYTLARNDSGMLMPEKIDGYVRKSKMTAVYAGIPVKMFFTIAGKANISASFAVETLLNAHTKYKRPKVKNNLPGVENIRLSAGGGISYRQIGIFCEYAVTPFFKQSVGADANVLSMGIRLGI